MTDNITVNIQSSIRIEGAEGVVYFDPIHISGEPHDADYILITHDHSDHFSASDIKKIVKPTTILFVPGRMMGMAQQVATDVEDICMVRPGERGEVRGLHYETVPSYNLDKSFHPKTSEWVGYIVTIDGKRIYVAGDTDATPEAREVSCDIAMIPIGGTYTMTAKQAAELVDEMQPPVVIPIHYGSFVGSKSDADIFKNAITAPTEVVIKL